MLTSIILLTALLGNVEPNSAIRMTCLDGRPLAEVYTKSFKDIQNYVMRVRELGIMAANGTLSVTDRYYLEDEKQVIIEEINRIIHQTQYIDIFGENHHLYEEGLNFILAYRSQVSNGYLVSKFKFPKLSIDRLGRLANRAFAIQGDQLNPEEGISRLQLNEFAIEFPDSSIDTVSADYGSASAIAWARKINEQRYKSGVRAIVAENGWNLKIDHSKFPLSLNNLKISRVTIVGQASNLIDLIDSINDFSNSTGVKARLGAEKSLQVFAEDGRNISLDLNGDENLAGLFAGALSSSASYVRRGSIELESTKAFKISDPDHWIGTDDEYKVELSGTGIASIDLTSMDAAIEALSNCDAGLEELNRLAVKIGMLASYCSE